MDATSSPTAALEAKLNKLAWALSGVVLLLVGVMRRVKIPSPVDFGFLPPIHATLNAVTALLLVGALVAIKRRRVDLHRNLIVASLGASTLFLLSYVAYHFTKTEVLFGDADHDGVLSAAERLAVAGVRPLYLVLLASHIVLAAAVLPFVLMTFTRAYTKQFARHKAMARWVFPLWLYVAVTGPACYLMLRPYYP
jgi:putative membrane protein